MSRIRKTFMAIFLGRGLIAIRQIVLVPILLRCWGTDYYGSWLIISAIPSFLSMSNLGLGTSAATKIATRGGPDQTEQNQLTLVTAWVLILVVFSLVALGLTIWYFIDKSAFSAIPDGFSILFFLVVALFVRMFAQPLHGWWVSNGQASKSIMLNNIHTIGELLFYLAIPLLSGKAPFLTLCLMIWTSVWFVFYALSTSKSVSGMFRPVRPSLTEAKSLLSVGIGHQLSPLWQGLLFQGSIILAGNLLGPSGAALWGALRVVNRAGNQILELVSQTVGPEFQRNYARNDEHANKSLHARSVLASFAIACGTSIGLMVLGAFAFREWTHHVFSEPPVIWLIMPFSLVPFAIWWVSGEYQRSINKPWQINLCGVFAACISLGLSWFLHHMGIISFAIGALAFEVIMAAYVLQRSLMLLGISYREFSTQLLLESRLFYRQIRNFCFKPANQ